MKSVLELPEMDVSIFSPHWQRTTLTSKELIFLATDRSTIGLHSARSSTTVFRIENCYQMESFHTTRLCQPANVVALCIWRAVFPTTPSSHGALVSASSLRRRCSAADTQRLKQGVVRLSASVSAAFKRAPTPGCYAPVALLRSASLFPSERCCCSRILYILEPCICQRSGCSSRSMAIGPIACESAFSLLLLLGVGSQIFASLAMS